MKTSFRFLGKTNTLKLTTLALIPAAMLTCTSCSTHRRGGQGGSEMSESKPGVSRVQTYRRTATVTAIDPATRRITLTAPDGAQTTFVAGPEVRNFDQIRVGDQVKATITQAVAVSLRPPGTAPVAGESSTVMVAPRGAKPGAVVTDTTEVTARIIDIDRKTRTATLQFPDGTVRTVQVGDDVNLSGIKPGDEVIGRVTESVAIQVEKP